MWSDDDLLATLQANPRNPLTSRCGGPGAIHAKKEAEAWTTFTTMSKLGEALLGQMKYAEAAPLFLKGYEGMAEREKTPDAGAQRLTQALVHHIA